MYQYIFSCIVCFLASPLLSVSTEASAAAVQENREIEYILKKNSTSLGSAQKKVVEQAQPQQPNVHKSNHSKKSKTSAPAQPPFNDDETMKLLSELFANIGNDDNLLSPEGFFYENN